MSQKLKKQIREQFAQGFSFVTIDTPHSYDAADALCELAVDVIMAALALQNLPLNRPIVRFLDRTKLADRPRKIVVEATTPFTVDLIAALIRAGAFEK